MKWLRNTRHWIAERLKDMFYGQNNTHAELGRVVVGLSGALMGLAVCWNALEMHQAIDLAALGGGLSGIIAAGAVLIGAKQWANTQQQLGQTLKAKQRLDEKECEDAR
jgi:hypothetical protein